jgi:hypothetical protein
MCNMDRAWIAQDEGLGRAAVRAAVVVPRIARRWSSMHLHDMDKRKLSH